MGDLTAKQHAFVAAYLGRAGLNATTAARMAGFAYPRQTGSRLLSNVDIQAAIAAWRAQVKREGIADLDYRVSVLNDLHGKLLTVIADRAAEHAALAADATAAPTVEQIRNLLGQKTVAAGAATGLIVRQVKAIGSGKTAQLVEEFAVDNPTIKSIAALHDQAAKELGQRVERHEHTGKDGEPIAVAHGLDLSAFSDDELALLKRAVGRAKGEEGA